jgi:hypothetical protein
MINMRSSAGPRRLTREWREKSDWSKDIPECYMLIYPHKMEENLLFMLGKDETIELRTRIIIKANKKRRIGV